jgi:hypothetical protein
MFWMIQVWLVAWYAFGIYNGNSIFTTTAFYWKKIYHASMRLEISERESNWSGVYRKHHYPSSPIPSRCYISFVCLICLSCCFFIIVIPPTCESALFFLSSVMDNYESQIRCANTCYFCSLFYTCYLHQELYLNRG